MAISRLLVINCGSATVKHALFEVEGTRVVPLRSDKSEVISAITDTVESLLRALPHQPDAIVHRVVMGGEELREPAILDEEVIAKLEAISPLAPLHNPPALEGIRAAARLGVPQIAVFDTAFFAHLPERAFRYAIPWRTAPDGLPLRRFGFHGWSHRSVMERYAELTGSLAPTIITLHLGGGCSAAAIAKGRAVDTSMGMTPLEGLLMGTRAGDLDPGLLLHLTRAGLSPDEVARSLNRESGLMALAGTSDMRELLRRKDPEAALAVEMFCDRATKYVGAYLAALGGAEAVIFTGGIGENAAEIRRRICQNLGFAGLTLDEDRNQSLREGRISSQNVRLSAWVIPTREELLIAREAADLLQRRQTP